MHTRNTSQQLRKSKSTTDIDTQQLSTITELTEISTELHRSQIESNSKNQETPFVTPTESTVTVVIDEEVPFITEEEIKDLGWKIYSSHEQELRSKLHIEYMNTYLAEDLIPKGLKLTLKPSIQDEALVDKWNKVLDTASKNLMSILIEHYTKRLLEVSAKRNQLNGDMDKSWNQFEKEEFVRDIKEELAPREEELRRMKDGKLDRDRQLKQRKENTTSKANTTHQSRSKFTDIVKRHIKEQLRKPQSRDGQTTNAGSRSEAWKSNERYQQSPRGFFEDESQHTRTHDRRGPSQDNRVENGTTNGDYKRRNHHSRDSYKGSRGQTPFHNNIWKERRFSRY